MAGLLTQIKAFGLTLILGILTGGIFQYYQLTVKSARPGKYSLYLLDFILWLFLILVVFMAMLLINQGEMRIYVLLALIIGAFIYYRYLWQRFLQPLSHAAQSTTAGFENGVRLLRKPIMALKKYRERRKNTPPDNPIE